MEEVKGRRSQIIFWEGNYGSGACLFTKRLERGRFVWPHAIEGKIHITSAQLSMLLEGIDWRTPERTWRPKLLSSPLFMYQFDLESLAGADAYSGTGAALCDCIV